MGNTERTRRLGKPLICLGGTFDPPHCGHVWLAAAAKEKFAAEVRVIPNGNPPHRQMPQVSWRQRVTMCRLAMREIAGVVVGNDEPPAALADRPHYSIDTLRRLRAKHPTRPLALLIGGDAWNALHEWRQWRSLRTVANVIVATRAGYASDALPIVIAHYQRHQGDVNDPLPAAGKIILWPCHPPAVAAASIRRDLAAGKNVSANLLLPAVYDYIARHQLYGLGKKPV